MELVLSSSLGNGVILYIDDIIVHGKSFSEMTHRLREIFTKLQKAGLTLKASKCKLFLKQVKFLGHIVSEMGIATDPSKTAAVDNWPVPCKVGHVRSFLGLVGYYRRFIPSFSNTAGPLYYLLRKSSRFKWEQPQQKSFNELKRLLVCAPILAFANDTDEFVVDTDASKYALGGVLSQIQSGVERVICYASRSLSQAEVNYCTTKRELLAVVHFVTDTFHYYLAGRQFTVRTDHASLTWLQNFRNAEGMIARWLIKLSEYDMKIEHRKGALHGNADGLSRIYQCPARRCPRTDCPDCTLSQTQNDTAEINVVTRAQAAKLSADNNPDNLDSVIPSCSLEKLNHLQHSDTDLKRFIQLFNEHKNVRPKSDIVKEDTAVVRILWTMWNQLSIVDNVLVRVADSGKHRFVVPLSMRKDLFKQLHENPALGHWGITRTWHMMRNRFYWPYMKADVTRWCQACNTCQQSKPGVGKGKTALIQEMPAIPFERVGIDIITNLPETERGNKCIVSITDYFTKWCDAFPTKDHQAETLADLLTTRWICYHGTPRRLHSDQGRELVGNVISQMCELLHIQKTNTLPYRPQSDGQVEKENGTVVQMLKTFAQANEEWDHQLPFIMMAYRATEHASTGVSPYQMVQGLEMSLPVDIMYHKYQSPVPWLEYGSCPTAYVEWLKYALQKTHTHARACLEKAAKRQRTKFNIGLKPRTFSRGDWVYKFYPPSAQPKLGRPYVGPYLVIQKHTDVVYDIQKSPEHKVERVHVDFLKPCARETETPDSWL